MHSTPKRQMKEEDKTGEQGEKFCLFAVALACLAIETRSRLKSPLYASPSLPLPFVWTKDGRRSEKGTKRKDKKRKEGLSASIDFSLSS